MLTTIIEMLFGKIYHTSNYSFRTGGLPTE